MTPTTALGIVAVAVVASIYFWRRRRGRFTIEMHLKINREEERPGKPPDDR